jgi:hypothetical protein
MNSNQHSNQSRLQLLETFIANEGLLQRFSDFENDVNICHSTDNDAEYPDCHAVSLVDRSLLSMYHETKALIEWFGLSDLIGGLSDMASDYMFTYKSNKQNDFAEAAMKVDDMRGKTQMVLGLIKCMTGLNRHIDNVEKLRNRAGGHLFSKYPEVWPKTH